MSFLNNCRQFTNLSAMKANFLQKINAALPLVADLVHAHVAMYTFSKKENYFTVISEFEPHTTYNPIKHSLIGKEIPKVQEPLIEKSIKFKSKYEGQRELDFGKFYQMYTIPIVVDYEVIAVICFEINYEDAQTRGFTRLLKTAFIILENAPKKTDNKMYRSISSRDGIIITDKNERIIFANMVASRIYHVLGVSNLLGCHLFDRQLTLHIKKETILPRCPYEKEIEVGNLVLIRRDIPINEAGNLLTRIVILSDVTEIRKKDKELKIKSAVIQEIHHRVKNNLQTIASILRLQARRSNSMEVKEALKESVNRILSISVVHEFLSQQGDENIDVMEVTKNILQLIQQNMLDSHFKLETEFIGETIILPSKQASNLALIINELILNSIEHGFLGRNYGKIGLKISQSDEAYIIELYDNGNGLPENFSDLPTKSLGLQIVRTLIEGDMNGSFDLYNDNGVHAKIAIPYKFLMESEVDV